MDDTYWLNVALSCRILSDDPSYINGIKVESAVGVALLDRNQIPYLSSNKEIVSSNILINEENKKYFIEHAERAVIFECLRNGIDVAGATLYVTKFPCADCARTITQFNLKRVVVCDSIQSTSSWYESQLAAMNIFDNSGICVDIKKVYPNRDINIKKWLNDSQVEKFLQRNRKRMKELKNERAR